MWGEWKGGRSGGPGLRPRGLLLARGAHGKCLAPRAARMADSCLPRLSRCGEGGGGESGGVEMDTGSGRRRRGEQTGPRPTRTS